MKKPILSFEERSSMFSPELYLAKLKFKREFEKSSTGIFIQNLINRLSIALARFQ